MRITKKDMQGMFNRLVKTLGVPVGQFILDYAPVYGGYVIEEVHLYDTGVSHPFGCRRYDAKTMYAIMDKQCQVLDYLARARGEKHDA